MSNCSIRLLFLRRLFFILLCCLLFASCAFVPEKNFQITDPDWEIAGKIGIRESTLRASSSLFQWRQQGEHYVIYLFNTLGQPELTLTGSNRYAMAQQKDGSTVTANTPEQLLDQVIGWHFPVSSVRYWIQGKLEGSEQNITRSEDDLLNSFNTTEWQATLGNYKPVTAALLPHKLKLQHEELTITLIIKEHAFFTP